LPLGKLPLSGILSVSWYDESKYTYRRSKFGNGVPVKGRRKYIPIGSMPAFMLAKTLPNNPLLP